MAHLHKKMKKGRPYYYIREMGRVKGRLKVINQVYLGGVERLRKLAQGNREPLTRLDVLEFGSVWLAHQIDRDFDLAGIIDSVIPRKKQEKGPSVGEFFLYAVMNRMIDSCSKRALPDWYNGTAIQFIRPVEIDELNSQRFWEKWDRVTPGDIERIAALFFAKIASLEGKTADCFLFDTTNYYTYMASDTDSELAARGKNKDGKDWLRQIGVALLVSRDGRLPLFYREYEGNRHDSRLFARIMKDVTGAMKNLGRDDAGLTIVFDKGMNSEENLEALDGTPGLHFITTYSPHYAEEFMRVKLDAFVPVDSPRNRELEREGKEDDRILAWRGKGVLWGKERSIVVTYNPLTATRQRFGFEKKLLALGELLTALRSKVRSGKGVWKDPETIERHVSETCERLHLPKDLYDYAMEASRGKPSLVFQKNHYRIGKHLARFGKNILVTDHMDWSTDDVVRACLDRNIVEQAFRQTKDPEQVSVLPLRHWTDGKIRCHILTCIMTLAYHQTLENRLHRAGVMITAATAMRNMRRLHSSLIWEGRKRNPERLVETPDEIQAAILRAFGHRIAKGGLQKIGK